MPNATVHGSIYDFPEYYDTLFGADWKSEFRFLRRAFGRYAACPVKRVFEPACGTGRLLVQLGLAGYSVAGIDLNARAVRYCNARLREAGLPATVRKADMCRYVSRRPFDAAFNMINSFRHLASERDARAHLQCVADSLMPGGIYLLGLHLTPAGEQECTEEIWRARRGDVRIRSRLWTKSVDHRRRVERVGMTFDVKTPRKELQLVDELKFRTYSAGQIGRLLDQATDFELAATHDFGYQINSPVEVDDTTEDVVFVLRKRPA